MGLVFRDILPGLEGGEFGELTEIERNMRLGAIASQCLLEDVQYAISGEFGTVSVSAERPIPRLKGS